MSSTIITELVAAQGNKEKIINANDCVIVAIAIYGVINNTLTTPPASPISEGIYIPAANATGAWAGLGNQILWWNPDGYWFKITPTTGMKLNHQLNNSWLRFNGSSWVVI